jgi:hypothetical protein
VTTREVDATAAGGDSQSGKARAARTARAPVPALSTTPVLRTGDRAVVRFRFCCYAEYLEPGAAFLFREGFATGLRKVKATQIDCLL